MIRIAAATAALFVFCQTGAVLAQAPSPPAKPGASAPAAKTAPSQPTGQTKDKGKPAPAAKPPSLSQLAAEGDAQAQYQYGMALKDGKGVRANAKQALLWLTLAGSAGVKEAAVQAARMYEQGQGTARNFSEAGRWWYAAGILGDQEAEARFVDLYLAGKLDHVGGPKGPDWIKARAETGDVKAQLALGDIHERGLNGMPDLSRAARWYRFAADLGDAEARFRLGRLLLKGPAAWRVPAAETAKDGTWTGAVWHAAKPKDSDETAVLLRPGQIEAERWLLLAAHQGHAGAQYVLGRTYVTGLDLPLNMRQGVRWLQAAAAQNHPDALILAADLAAAGQGFAGQVPVRAWAYYDVAAALGRKEAEGPRDAVAKTLSPRQLTRARQLSQDLRELKGS